MTMFAGHSRKLLVHSVLPSSRIGQRSRFRSVSAPHPGVIIEHRVKRVVDALLVPATQVTVIPVAAVVWVADGPLAAVSVAVVATGARHNATTRLGATVRHEGQQHVLGSHDPKTVSPSEKGTLHLTNSF